MVNRVFCYSEEQARKNGNNTSIGKIVLQIVGMAVLFVVVVISAFFSTANILGNPFYMFIIILGFTAFAVWYAIKSVTKFRTQLTGFATDTENNVYFASKLNNGENFIIGGMAAGGIIDGILGKNNSFAGNLAGGAGAIMTLYSMNKSAKIMQNPEIIAKMIECANTTTGTEIRQILKVHSYTQDSHKIKIECDYKMMRDGKIKYNKTMNVYKSYNCFDELMNVLLNVRGN